jgi:hypothetical protein
MNMEGSVSPVLHTCEVSLFGGRADHHPPALAHASLWSPTMAAAATPDPPATTALLELALAVGYSVTDQRWRAAAACVGADPEVFLPARGESFIR